jgi:hypothetical protein
MLLWPLCPSCYIIGWPLPFINLSYTRTICCCLRLELPSIFFCPGFPTKVLYRFIFSRVFRIPLSSMFCWPCITVYRYSTTNVMHYSFSLLRLKGLYMFRSLLLILRIRYTNDVWYIACVLCQLAAPRFEFYTPILLQPTDITRTWGWASNARNM